MYKEAGPCANCPLLPEGSEKRKAVTFQEDGSITYQPVSNGCGYSVKKASGPPADHLRRNMQECEGPDIFENNSGLLGRLGIRTKVSLECPSFPTDPTSRRQITTYFEGE